MPSIINGQGRVGVRVVSSGGSGGSTPSIVTSGLVLNLDAGNAASYPGTGTVWTDLSGNGNNGTLVNGVGYSSANGGSLVFDGSNDYVETNYVLPSSASNTISIWAKSTSSLYHFNRPIGNADTLAGLNGTSIIWGYYNPTNLYIVRRNGANTGTYDMMTSSIPDLLTSIKNITVTYDHSGSGSKVYINGNLITTNSNIGFLSSLTLKIGNDGYLNCPFNGNIYNVQVYNKALTQSEVTQNFDALKGRYGL